ncbi:MAG: GAF domain-containing protein [Chloroflexia bacterium]|nr:GAF domain-containing protein [Chloroflexia bacterium]
MAGKRELQRLQEELDRRETEISALQQIAMAVASDQDLTEILQTIVRLTTQVMGCPKAAIFELYEDEGRMIIRAWEGLSDDYAESSRSVDLQSLRAKAIMAGQAMPVANIRDEPDLQDVVPLAEQEGYRAFLDVPLRSRDHTVGLLSAYYAEVHEFAPDEVELLLSFADQAAVALETARLLRSQERRIAELASLEQVGRAISGTLDLGELFERIYEQTSRLMDTTNIYMALYYEESDEWEMMLYIEDGERQPSMPRMKVGSGLTGWIIRHREPLLLKRGASEFLRQQGIERIGRPSLSWLGVPMLLAEKVVGVIGIQSYEEEYAYDEGHMRILATIARQAAVAVENARLFRERERRIAELAGLEEMGRAISGILDLEELVERIHEQTSRLLDTDDLYIALYDTEADEISFPLAFEHGERRRWLARKRGQGLTEHVIQQRRPVWLHGNVRAELEARGIEAIGEVPKAWLGVPILVGDQAIGVIAVQNFEDELAFDEGHVGILQAISRQISVAIENARTVSEMRRLNDSLEETLGRQQQLLETIRDLSTPALPLLEGIILMPLVGHIDSNRAQRTVDQLLQAVQQYRTRIVILDITGVPVVDTMVAQALVQTAQAVRLLGAEPVLVGIMPEVAQTMVSLGINLAALTTRSDLQSGLEYAMERLETLGRRI